MPPNPPPLRTSPLHIQHLSPPLHAQIFPKTYTHRKPPPYTLRIAQKHLQTHHLLHATRENVPEIQTQIEGAELQGTDIAAHFKNIGREIAEPYYDFTRSMAKVEVSALPQMPKVWSHTAGWTRYTGNDANKVEYPNPDDEALIFDVETLVSFSPYPIFATAVSQNHWYSWTAPFLSHTGDLEIPKLEFIKMGDHPRIIIGHNVSYDRARILEEYSMDPPSQIRYVDTLSLHCSVRGLSAQQRGTWLQAYKEEHKVKDEDDTLEISSEKPRDSASGALLSYTSQALQMETAWIKESSMNSLKYLAEFYLKKDISKLVRDFFITAKVNEVKPGKFQELIQYCADDVATTFEIFKHVFELYIMKTNGNPVTFAGMMEMGSAYLPVDTSWNKYLLQSQTVFDTAVKALEEKLTALVSQFGTWNGESEQVQEDPWLSQLDWNVPGVKLTKSYVVKGVERGAREYKNQRAPNKPQWYRDLCKPRTETPIITIRSRLTPLLLGVQWKGYPIYHLAAKGWCYKVPQNEILDKDPVNLTDLIVACRQKIEDKGQDPSKSKELQVYERANAQSDFNFYRIPHPQGEKSNCGNPLARSYVDAFEMGIMSSTNPVAKEVLKINAECSYWVGSQNRIKGQFVAYENEHVHIGAESKDASETCGAIIPQIQPMGTVSRRAVEPTWLTASNAKPNRVGSELKSLVKAPKGWSIVGADVDSQELWISSLLGDQGFGMHGATALGFMTLQGNKADGTDLHSHTASILKITRDASKIFNYGRIYGAGARYANTLLRQFNPSLTEGESASLSEKLYKATKGAKARYVESYGHPFCKRPFWYGGTESYMFNALEKHALDEARTPVLQVEISEALKRPFVSDRDFLTSRINWIVQSSAVDYLHLLLVSVKYLFSRHDIQGRYMISIHDEVRYLVKEEDAERAALALQIANLWVRSLFAYQCGIDDLPLSCAFFSMVDIDHVLRKEVYMPCTTPSNPTAISPGASRTIYQTLELTKNSIRKTHHSNTPNLNIDHKEESSKLLNTLGGAPGAQIQRPAPTEGKHADEIWLKAQAASGIAELRSILSEPPRG